jgi:SOS-response transcriptional repressor LexA
MIGETKRTEDDLLAFIDSYWEEFWTSPSYEQIGLFLGLSSKSSVHYHVHRLIEAGVLELKQVPGSRRPLFRRKGFQWT